MSYRALMRRKLLEQIYDKMSDEEKRLFVYRSMEDKNHTEIMKELESIKRGQSFWIDLGSNVAGNALFDGIAYLFSRLIKRF